MDQIEVYDISAHSFPIFESLSLFLNHKRNPKPSGFPRSRFEELPPKDFLCQKCCEVVKRPVECSECGVLYCLYCAITDHRGIRHRRELACSSCLQTSKHREISKVLKKIIGNLRIRCKYPDCGAVLPLNTIKIHEKQCLLKEVQCANSLRCSAKGYLKDFIRLDCDRSFRYTHIGKASFVCSEKCKTFIEFERVVSNRDKQNVLKSYKKALMQIPNE